MYVVDSNLIENKENAVKEGKIVSVFNEHRRKAK